MPFIIKWLLFRHVRQAVSMERHVRRLARAQQDLLSPQAGEALADACREMREIIGRTTSRKELENAMQALEKAANKWLKPYPLASVRENVEVFLVAIAVAMGIRTFFLQPFKIPTGSMQPTLYGITEDNLLGQPEPQIPAGLRKFYESWFLGTSYYHVVAKNDGEITRVESPRKLIFFNLKQTFYIGHEPYTVWFPPDGLLSRAGLASADGGYISPKQFRAGEDVLKLRVRSGDHLFVDRLTYNFRRPKRGEIIVFETRGIPKLRPDQFYIKRLVALGGEKTRIGDDNHLVIDGVRLDAGTPRFERVYTFDPQATPQRSRYFGHVNGHVARQLADKLKDDNLAGLAPCFPDSNTVFQVRPNHYLAMGDNTLYSSDSRYWEDLPRTNVIGKSFFVYWPFTRRFGWEHLAHQ